MSPFELIKFFFGKREVPKGEREKCAKLITSHLSTLDQLCEIAVQKNQKKSHGIEVHGVSIISSPYETIPENEKEELLARVMEHLQADDFKVVRNYRGDAKFKTYLTAVVSKMVVDIVRQKEGRCRARERAEKMDEVGQRIYNLAYEKKYSLEDVQNSLRIDYGVLISMDEIKDCLEKMRGRGKKKYFLWGETGYINLSSEGSGGMEGELVIPDSEPDPEVLFAERESSTLAMEVLSECLDTLQGGDLLLFRMRYPMNEDEDPKSYEEIGKFHGFSADTAKRKVEAILRAIRKKMISKGLSFQDFF